MEISKKNDMEIIRLSENTFWDVDRSSIEDNLQVFKMNLRDYIIRLKRILDSDFDELSDQELYTKLSEIYDMELNYEDYLYILSRKNNRKYVDIKSLPTTMYYKSIKREGTGKDLARWNQLYQVRYLVAVTDTFESESNKNYSSKEIKELVNNNDIVLLNRKDKEIDFVGDITEASFETLPTLNLDVRSYRNNIVEFVLNNFNFFGEILRKEFTKERVYNDINEILDELDYDLNYVFDRTQSKDESYVKLAKACKKWYDLSIEKDLYQGIQKKLSR